MVIKYNKNIYKLSLIKRAIKDFDQLAEFKIKNTSEYISVDITNIKNNLDDNFRDEFSNYVLSL